MDPESNQAGQHLPAEPPNPDNQAPSPPRELSQSFKQPVNLPASNFEGAAKDSENLQSNLSPQKKEEV